MALNPMRYTDDWMMPTGYPYSGMNTMTDNCPWWMKVQRDMDRMSQMLTNDMRSDFGMDTRPSSLEEYRSMTNPIVTDAEGNQKMQLHFDLKHFKPEEIKVECTGDKLSVDANHEYKGEHQYVKRHYHRQVKIPTEVDPETMKSTLNRQGIMTIHAPIKRAIEAPMERTLPILHTKQPKK